MKSIRGAWRRSLFLVVAMALLAGGGYFAWTKLAGNGDELKSYQFATVQRGDIEDLVTATGTLQPRDYVDVGAQVSGQLKKIHVEIGTEVKAGDLLAEIDPTVYRARVDAGRAQLRNLRAQLADKEAQRVLAESQYKRQKNLMADDATTAESLQNAEATLQSARAQIDALKAQVDQTDSTLRADAANLDYARIYAPMAGTVVSITARQGQTLNTNQQAPTILRVADLATMTVQTQVSEADVSRLKLGVPAYFTTLGSERKRWYGKLEKIEPTPTVTNNVVLYNALFDVPNPDGVLMTQMTAQVFFVIAEAKDALLVPMAALTRNPRGNRPGGLRAQATGLAGAPAAGERAPRVDSPPPAPQDGTPRVRRGTVRVKTPQGTLEERPVEMGVTNRVQAQILSGLAEGEEVVAGLVVATPAAGGTGDRPRMPPRL